MKRWNKAREIPLSHCFHASLHRYKNPVVKTESGPALSNAETETRSESETKQASNKEPEIFNALVCK